MWTTIMPSTSRGQKRAVNPGTEVTDGFKPPWRYWELNQDLLQKQQVLLITGLSLLLWIHVISQPISSHGFKIYI